jgi:hypothetical protein
MPVELGPYASLFAPSGSANFHERVTDGVRAWQQQERLDAVSAGPRK